MGWRDALGKLNPKNLLPKKKGGKGDPLAELNKLGVKVYRQDAAGNQTEVTGNDIANALSDGPTTQAAAPAPAEDIDVDAAIASALQEPSLTNMGSKKRSPSKPAPKKVVSEKPKVEVLEAWEDKVGVAYTEFEATKVRDNPIYRITIKNANKEELGQKLAELGLRGELSNNREEGRDDNYLVKAGENDTSYIAITRRSLETAFGLRGEQQGQAVA